MGMMIMKKAILEEFRSYMPDKITMAKEFFADIEKRFVNNEKAKISTLLTSLISMRVKAILRSTSWRCLILLLSRELFSLNSLRTF